jgi:hypothetical protein
MPLIKCRECGNPVSTEAAACSRCGAAEPTVPFRSDVDALIAKYGPPDRDQSTEHDNPASRIPKRYLIYEAERVRAVFWPVYAPDGSYPPNYTWKLMGFENLEDSSLLTLAEAVDRLKSRKKE